MHDILELCHTGKLPIYIDITEREMSLCFSSLHFGDSSTSIYGFSDLMSATSARTVLLHANALHFHFPLYFCNHAGQYGSGCGAT